MSTTSSGNTRTVAPAPPAAKGIVDIRRGAVLKALEDVQSSAGNAITNLQGHAPSNEAPVGDVQAPGKEPPDENTGKPEPVPTRMSKDSVGWGRAAAAARKLPR